MPDSAVVSTPRFGRIGIRAARLVAIALIVGVGVAQLVFTVSDWHLRDMGAYWEAALRLRAGDPLYPALADAEASEVYRYAPWFAWLWVPLTLLPRPVVDVLWSILLLAASAAALEPLVRRRAWLLVALMTPILVGISAIGNVHPLLVAGLVHGVERRGGPLAIAAAASLKVVPIVFILTYLGRRQWRMAAITLVLTALLTAPMLLHDLSAYATDAGAASGLIEWWPLFVVAVAGCAVASVRLAATPFGWLASATTAVVATPRLFVYDVSYLIVALARRTP